MSDHGRLGTAAARVLDAVIAWRRSVALARRDPATENMHAAMRLGKDVDSAKAHFFGVVGSLASEADNDGIVKRARP